LVCGDFDFVGDNSDGKDREVIVWFYFSNFGGTGFAGKRHDLYQVLQRDRVADGTNWPVHRRWNGL
jgi:hypothetical protein